MCACVCVACMCMCVCVHVCACVCDRGGWGVGHACESGDMCYVGVSRYEHSQGMGV